MYIVLLNYMVPLIEVDAHMIEHVNYLKKHYANGNFIVSGRKVPRTGGAIITNNLSRIKLEEILKEDPFYTLGLAEFDIIEFQSSMICKELEEKIK